MAVDLRNNIGEKTLGGKTHILQFADRGSALGEDKGFLGQSSNIHCGKLPLNIVQKKIQAFDMGLGNGQKKFLRCQHNAVLREGGRVGQRDNCHIDLSVLESVGQGFCCLFQD